MKKIVYLLSIVALLFSCTSQDVEFDDFAYQTVYFPFQTPVRSIMLGDEVLGDNSIDLEHAFSIGAAFGGAYENSKDRVLTVELATELAANITDGSNELKLLPAAYYTATFDKIVIPAGSFSGKMRVDLTDAFFADSLAVGLHYVLPVKITDAAGDSVLNGQAASNVASPDPRIADDWAITPKNYVLFGIKYANETHGVYLLRGKRTNTADAQDVVSYSTRFLNENDQVMLSTKSLTESYMAAVGGEKESADAKYSMKLAFNKANKSVTVSQKDASTVVVSGTGSYYSKDDGEAESYNEGNKHRTIYLDYTYEDGGNTYQVNDSLVFVDTDMKFEEFAVKVVNP